MKLRVNLILVSTLLIFLIICTNTLVGLNINFSNQNRDNSNQIDMNLYFTLAYYNYHNRSIRGASALLDVNDDGFLDIALVSRSHLYLIQNNGDNTFSEYNSIQSKNSVGWGMHDFNQDGRMDLYLAQENKPDVMINNGDGTLTSLNLGNEGLGIVRTALFADFNNDDYIDSYISCSSFNTNHHWNQIHQGLPNGSYSENKIDTILNPPIPDFWHKWANAPWGLKGEWWI
jgi:hypothetical protein